MMTNREMLENRSSADAIKEHDLEECGICYFNYLQAQTAREMLAEGRDASPTEWWQEVEKRWHESKFFKFWKSETEAGRDPNASFKERGWLP